MWVSQLLSFAKAYLNVTKPYDIAVFDLPGLTVGNPAPINKRTVCRSGVGYEQSTLLIHHQGCMNLGNARVVQGKFIVGDATNS